MSGSRRTFYFCRRATGDAGRHRWLNFGNEQNRDQRRLFRAQRCTVAADKAVPLVVAAVGRRKGRAVEAAVNTNNSVRQKQDAECDEDRSGDGAHAVSILPGRGGEAVPAASTISPRRGSISGD
jgi:hypothetical protein